MVLLWHRVETPCWVRSITGNGELWDVECPLSAFCSSSCSLSELPEQLPLALVPPLPPPYPDLLSAPTPSSWVPARPLSLSLSVSSSSSETVSGSFRHRELSSWTGANGGRPWMPQLKVLQALRSEGRKTDWEICKGSVSFSIHLRSCALFISVSLSLSQSRASRNSSFFPYREFTQQKWEKMRHEDSTLRNKWTNNKRTKGGCWRHTLCCP